MTRPAAAAALHARPRADDPTRLVVAAQRGDRAAFAELYARFSRAVHGVLLAHVPYRDVEDLVQDVFVVAMEHLGRLREPAAFGGWLLAIARNRSVDHLRRAHTAVELPDDLAADGVDRSDAFLVMAAIRDLPEAYRETLTLRLVEGMTGPEIAGVTGLTEGSVRVNLHRGMQQLRARLERRSS